MPGRTLDRAVMPGRTRSGKPKQGRPLLGPAKITTIKYIYIYIYNYKACPSQQWSVGLITLPHNFKTILDKTEKPQDENNNSSDSGLKVVCVGLSRTGTSSLKAALSQLLPGRYEKGGGPGGIWAN